jgi:hypothetical protein
VGAPDPEIYPRLRQQVLELRPELLGDPLLLPGGIVATLLDIAADGAVATLVGVIDGTSSLYLSRGGGLIGAGSHPEIAVANGAWLEITSEFLPLLGQTTSAPVPADGLAQLVAVTANGLRTAMAPEEELIQGRHPLSPLFAAAQGVITQMRLLGLFERG